MLSSFELRPPLDPHLESEMFLRRMMTDGSSARNISASNTHGS